MWGAPLTRMYPMMKSSVAAVSSAASPDQQEEQQREGPAQVGPGPLAEAHAVDGGEAVDVAHQSILLLSSEKQRLMSRIKTKSTTPVAISASRWSPEA